MLSRFFPCSGLMLSLLLSASAVQAQHYEDSPSPDDSPYIGAEDGWYEDGDGYSDTEDGFYGDGDPYVDAEDGSSNDTGGHYEDPVDEIGPFSGAVEAPAQYNCEAFSQGSGRSFTAVGSKKDEAMEEALSLCRSHSVSCVELSCDSQ